MAIWKVLPTDKGEYLIRSRFSDGSYQISLTPCQSGKPVMAKGWHQHCSIEDFQIYAKTYNPNIEAETTVLMDKLKSALGGLDTEKTLTGSDGSEERTLTVESPLGRHGLSKFTWRFECTLMSAEKYSQQFVLPLFTMTVALSHQTDLMEAILQRKDREIAEHVANGSVVKRGHLETRKFDADAFYADSLNTQVAKSALYSPVVSLCSHPRASQLITRLEDDSDLITTGASPTLNSNNPKCSPVKPVLATTPEQHIPDEKSLEEQRRAEIERLAAKPVPAKKRKQKSVF